MGNNCCSREIIAQKNIVNQEEILNEIQTCPLEILSMLQWIDFRKFPKNPILETLYYYLDFLNEYFYNLLSQIEQISFSLTEIRDFRLCIQQIKDELHKNLFSNFENFDENDFLLKLINLSMKKTVLKSKATFLIVFYDFETKQNINIMSLNFLYSYLKGIKSSYNSKISMISAWDFWDKCIKQDLPIKLSFFFDVFADYIKKTKNIILNRELQIVIANELDLNNDCLLGIEVWDQFYSEIWSNSIKRRNLIQRSEDFKLKPSEYPEIQLKIIDFLQENKIISTFTIKETGFIPENETFTPKNLLFDSLTFGKDKQCDIILDNDKISRKHFELQLKYNILQFQNENQKKLESDFYISNFAKKNIIAFLVDEKGFAISKDMIININGNYLRIIDVVPFISAYSDPELNFVETKPKIYRKSIISVKKQNEEFFIELEFFKKGPENIKKFKYTVPSKNDFFQINIGSSKNKKINNNIYIEDPKGNYVHKAHCFIYFNPKKACWIIKDETYNKDKFPFYKTFVFGCSYNEYLKYQNLGKNENYKCRGLKLINGMKLFIANFIIEVYKP